MKVLISNLKLNLKELAASIKEAKKSRKTQRNGYVSGLSDLQFEFRTKHIFRCLLRGRTLLEIESSRAENPPDNSWLGEIVLHKAISHLYNHYTDLKYEHAIQCRCSKCREKVQ